MQIEQDGRLAVKSNEVDQTAMFSPTFYVVEGTRRLTRPMMFESASDGTLTWTFQVNPDSADPRALEENFSPGLFVSKVRAYTVSGDNSGRFPLSISRLQVDLGAVVRCRGSDLDPTEVTADSCPGLQTMTPTYVNLDGLRQRSVVWQLQTPGSGLSQNSTVFIEFTVSNPHGTGRPFLVPVGHDFSVLPSGANRTDVHAFRLSLDNSPVEWRVESTSTSGTNRNEFSLQVEGPSTINAGGSRFVNVTLRALSDGIKTATATINLRDPSNNLATVSAGLTALVGEQTLVVQPGSVRFDNEINRTTLEPLPLPWRKRFLIVNDFSTPLIRTDVSVISGPDAGAFRIYKEPGNQPIEPTLEIRPGEIEIISVDFCPQHRGDFDTQVTITGNAGTMGAPVRATSTIMLHGTAPAAPAALCP